MQKKIIILLILVFGMSSIYSQELIPYRIKSKWGFSDFEGNLKIQPKYDSVSFPSTWFSEEYPKAFIVYKNGYAGLIDNNENFIIQLDNFDQIEDISEKHFSLDDIDIRLMKVRKNGKYGLISNRELKKDTEFDKLEFDYVWNKEYKVDLPVLIGLKNGQNFRIDEFGNETLLNPIKNKSQSITILGPNSNITVTSDNKIIKSKIGKTYGSVEKSSLTEYFDKGKVGLIKSLSLENPEFIIPPIYDSILVCNYDFLPNEISYEVERIPLSFVILKKDKIGVLNSKGEILTNFEYDGYSISTKDFIIYEKDKRMGVFIYDNKKDIYSSKYLKIEEDRYSKLFIVTTTSGKGYINREGFEYFKD